jgi:hypothetical protein
MNWGARRRLVIEIILAACGLAIIAVVVIAVLYKAPSCMDGKQNQGEGGVDCGGPCPFACTIDETAPTVEFIRAVSSQPGRTDAIAYLQNRNDNAELLNASYSISFYNANETLVAHRTGTISIPAATTIPLFIAGLYNGDQTVTQAFLSFDTSSYRWLRVSGRPVVPIPSNIQTQISGSPRITATLSNPIATPLYGATVVATVFDPANNAIAASQTYVPEIPAQGTAPVIFTWNEPFNGIASKVEILPVPLAPTQP